MTLSMDLRDRAVAAVLGGESCRAAAARFGVSAASVVRWMQRYRLHGSAEPALAVVDADLYLISTGSSY